MKFLIGFIGFVVDVGKKIKKIASEVELPLFSIFKS